MSFWIIQLKEQNDTKRCISWFWSGYKKENMKWQKQCRLCKKSIEWDDYNLRLHVHFCAHHSEYSIEIQWRDKTRLFFAVALFYGLAWCTSVRKKSHFITNADFFFSYFCRLYYWDLCLGILFHFFYDVNAIKGCQKKIQSHFELARP